jgi:hypothetical protein
MIRVAIRQLLRQPVTASKELIDARVAELEGRFQMLSLEVQRLNRDGTRTTASTEAFGNSAENRAEGTR